MRDDVAGIGVILLIIGGIAYLYQQQATIFGYTYTVGYPYRDLGTGLVILAFVAFVIAAAMPKESKSAPKASTSYSSPAASPTAISYCTKCGQQLRSMDVFCPRCGTKR